MANIMERISAENKTTISKIYLKFQLLTIPPTGNYFPIYQLNPSTIFQRHFDFPLTLIDQVLESLV